jgi:hypothetical protein
MSTGCTCNYFLSIKAIAVANFKSLGFSGVSRYLENIWKAEERQYLISFIQHFLSVIVKIFLSFEPLWHSLRITAAFT